MAQSHPFSLRDLQLRDAGEDDEERLFGLFAACQAELSAAILGWDDAQRETFLHLQFRAREDHYRREYPAARWRVVVVQGEFAGQIVVASVGDELCLVDLSLLPEFRNRGIGGALLRELLGEAAGAGKRVVLHVHPHNPAARLYLRHGFAYAAEEGVYRRMEWRPAAAEAQAGDSEQSAGVS